MVTVAPGWRPLPRRHTTRRKDRYVAIDRIDGPSSRSRRSLANRRSRDRTARFRSRDDRTDRGRAGSRSPGPRRSRRGAGASAASSSDPLRPSDVFLVGGLTPDPADWEESSTSTRAGRLAAKASLYSTAAPAPLAEPCPTTGSIATWPRTAARPAPPTAEPPDGSEPPRPVAPGPSPTRRSEASRPMARPTALPAARLTTGEDFLAASADADLVYFLCNVGDADAQLVLLPKSPTSGFRRAVVVDAGKANKLPAADRRPDQCRRHRPGRPRRRAADRSRSSSRPIPIGTTSRAWPT